MPYGDANQIVVGMVRHAHELGLFTSPYMFNEEDAVKMAKAGADVLVAHVGLPTEVAIAEQVRKFKEISF